MTGRDRIIMMKREMPKVETPPNSRTLAARYRRVMLAHLPGKIAKTPVVQELGKMALNQLPSLYNKDTSKIKNKKN